MASRTYAQLLATYGPQGWWPIKGRYKKTAKNRQKTPLQRFEIAIGAILTQNTNWNNVEKALMCLREAKKLTPKAILQTRVDHLAKLIRSSGYHNQKARKLKEYAAFLTSKKSINRENLLSIWGVGEETADSILLYAYDQPIFVVDAYTKRVFSRMGKLPKNPSYETVQKYFHKELPQDAKVYNEYHALIVQLAKEHCKTTPICTGCPLDPQCKKIVEKKKKGKRV